MRRIMYLISAEIIGRPGVQCDGDAGLSIGISGQGSEREVKNDGRKTQKAESETLKTKKPLLSIPFAK